MKQVTLKGQPICILGTLPSIGSKSPFIIGVDAELKERSLKEFQGKKKVICFVPSLDTSVCSTSAQTFNKEIQAKKEAVVIYCSMDLPFALQRICMQDKAHYGNITFLSLYRNPQVAETFGARIGDGPLAGLCARAVFVLDEKDRIIHHELVGEITQEPNYSKALSYV